MTETVDISRGKCIFQGKENEKNEEKKKVRSLHKRWTFTLDTTISKQNCSRNIYFIFCPIQFVLLENKNIKQSS